MAPVQSRGRKRKAEAVTSSPGIHVEKDTGEREFHDVDKEILECPSCLEHFTPPVYQCQNGHAVCSACPVKILHCPSCSQPIRTFIRNFLAEKIVESLQVKCPHALHGCKQMVKFADAEEHRKNLCAYRPCPRPVPGCSREVSMTKVSLHLEVEHRVRAYRFQGKGRPPLQSEVEQFVILKPATWKIPASGGCMLVHRMVVEGLGTIIFWTSFKDHKIPYVVKVKAILADPSDKMGRNYLIHGASAGDIRRRGAWKSHFLLCSETYPTQLLGTVMHFSTPAPLK